jgi:hypothetical protein
MTNKLFTLSVFLLTCQPVLAQADTENIPKYSFERRLYLGQNDPDPLFTDRETRIPYKIVGAFNSSIIVIDSFGKMILSFENLDSQTGDIIIRGKDLPVGIYRYALIVHGRARYVKSLTVQNP